MSNHDADKQQYTIFATKKDTDEIKDQIHILRNEFDGRFYEVKKDLNQCSEKISSMKTEMMLHIDNISNKFEITVLRSTNKLICWFVGTAIAVIGLTVTFMKLIH